jgi:hypothetical protein
VENQCGLLTKKLDQKEQDWFIGVRGVINFWFNIPIHNYSIVARFIKKNPRERLFTAVFPPSKKCFTIGGTENSVNTTGEPGH